MKYIIVAKNIFDGTSTNDVPNPLAITEIATELVITRLYLIMLLQEGAISTDDCIVTTEERKCLYTNIFKNVLDYKQFIQLGIQPEQIIDFLENSLFDRLSAGSVDSRLIPYKPFYKNWERDKELIKNVSCSSLDGYDLSQPFVALVIRKRAAWSEKNMSDGFWTELINKLTENKKTVFVFGKETNTWANGKNVQYIANYQDWCTIVQHENCKHVASTMTGGVYPCLIFGNSNIDMTLIDNTQLMAKHGGDPSFYDECINFSKVKIEYINEIPTIEQFYGRITKNL